MPENAADLHWQERLLPVMIRMVVGLTVFFFLTSIVQLAYLHLKIQNAPQIDYERLFEAAGSSAQPEFQALVLLDANVLERRYHQANVLLMSRVWARYLGFVTGMILALVGAVFILGKLREEATEVNAGAQGATFTIRSASPGLVMAFLGVVLMITTIVTHHDIATADSPVFLRLNAGKSAINDSLAAPPPEFP